MTAIESKTYLRTFQLTPSRRATESFIVHFQDEEISTHALTEGDYVRVSTRYQVDISTHALTEGD